MQGCNKIKIVVLGTRGFPNIQGGVESHCHNLYSRLRKKGCKVIVLGRQPYIGSDVINCDGVRLLPLACSKNKYTEALLHTLRGVLLARRIRPDILHFHAIGPSLLVPLARLLGFKVVMTHHGPDYKREKWGIVAKTVLKLGESLGSRWANEIICISESIADSIKNKYKRQVHIIPNGVQMPENVTSIDVLKKYSLTANKYILAVGRLVPEKGFRNLIEAFSRSHLDDWKLVIVGDADHETPYSRQLKSKAANSNKVVLTGFIQGDALNEIYFHAGLFVLPSYYEGLSIALLEALSYGLSVLVSDIAPNREVGLGEDRYFAVGNEEALAKKLDCWIKSGPLSDEEQTKQIKMVREKYNWDDVAEQVLQVYKDAFVGRND